jgi:hypothetical protein
VRRLDECDKPPVGLLVLVRREGVVAIVALDPRGLLT